ncbi:MAG: NFACT RNA binding domain-containing protein [Bacteroidia bacterium]
MSMHFHYFALKALSSYLNEQWANAHVEACFSQNKQELVIESDAGYIRIGCQTPLTYVSPGKEFTKARKNVVDLFPELLKRTFQSAEVVPHDRVMLLNFSRGYQLILKLHGMKANVILRQSGTTIKIFRKDKEEDREYQPVAGPFSPEHIDQNPESSSVAAIKRHLREISPIYDGEFAKRIARDMDAGKSFQEAFHFWEKKAEDGQYYIVKEEKKAILLLFEPLDTALPVQAQNGIKQGIGSFLAAHYQYSGYHELYRKVQREVTKPAEKFRKIYASYQDNIKHLEESRNPEELGHILMANLHAIEPGAKVAELDDFYHEGKVRIKLKPNISPQENAARYYDKNKQRKAKLSYLRDQLDEIEEKRNEAEANLEAMSKIPAPTEIPFDPKKGFDARQLREHKKQLRALLKEKEAEEDTKHPFRTFRFHNYDIFVGRNGPNNDLLTFKFSSKEDIWLHAKDVPGSHVVIRNKPGHPPPIEVLEYAAGLAAYYSKLRNETLAPVSYTPRKYVRKRKGDPPGMVVVEREEVIMMEPGR